MPFDIEEFKAKQNRYDGYLKTNKFLVQVSLPAAMIDQPAGYFSLARDMEFFCQDAVLPGYQLMTGNVRRWGYGPNEIRPHAPNFQQVQLLVNVDGNMDTWKFYQTWLETIIPHKADRGIATQSDISQGAKTFEIEYKQRYATDVVIMPYADNGEILRRVVLREAFPSNVSQIQLSWGNTNEIAQFQVFMEYLDWYDEDILIPTEPPVIER